MTEPLTDAGRHAYIRDLQREIGRLLGQTGALAVVDELVEAVRAAERERTAPLDDLPDSLEVNGHLFAHVAACPCPRIQGEVNRLRGEAHDE